MQKEIHPKYFPKANVVCACGNSFIVGSTREKIEVEICSNCHPFYTGNEKIIDSAGRVERFKARRAAAKPVAKKKEKAKAKSKTEKSSPKKEPHATTLAEVK